MAEPKRDPTVEELLEKLDQQRTRILIAETKLARVTSERDRALCAVVLLMHEGKREEVRLSLDLYDRVKSARANVVMTVEDDTLVVRIEERPEPKPEAPIGKVREEVGEAEGGGTPCATDMRPPE